MNAAKRNIDEQENDILSGKTRINRKQLREMSADIEEDVAAVVTQIKDGTFESSSSGTSQQEATNMQPWEKQFAAMTNEFRQILRTHAKTDDTASAKTSLREYISMLEDLYKSL